MKKITLLTLVFAAGLSYGQNVGINQPNPTNSLHISPITIGNDPLRVDNMQAYTSGDTTLMIIDQTTGIVRYVDKSDLGGMIGNILFQNSTFLDSLNNYVGGGGGTSYTAGTGIGITGTTINNTGDLSSSNEYNTGFQINGTNLEITDGGGTLTVPLSSFADGDSDPTNEIELPTTAITGQVITWNGSAWVAQNSASGADNWGSQVIVTGGTGFSGDGTTGNPLIYTSAAGTDDQNIQGSAFNATTDDLTIGIEGGTSETINLSSLNNDNDWHITGNSGTAIATNFIGTTDNIPLGFRTNNSEAMRILSTGRIAVNSTATFATSILHSAAGGGDDAFTAIHNGTGDGLYSQHSGAGNGVVGNVSGAGDGVRGISSSTGNGVYGINTSTGNGITGLTTGTGVGVYGGSTSTGTGHGVLGVTNQNNTFGVFGFNNAALGTGVLAAGNNLTATYLVQGSGGAFTGARNGVVGYAEDLTGNASGVYGVSYSPDGQGVYGIDSSLTGTSLGVYGAVISPTGFGIYGLHIPTTGNGAGVYGATNSAAGWGLYSGGDFGATGAKLFIIDHPLDPANKILKHACIESNEVLNVYRGNTILDADGKSIITLPDYFTTLNINYSYTLTPIGSPSVMYVLEEVNNNGEFKIAGGQPGQKISWYVYGQRNDKAIQYSENTKNMVVEKPDHLKGLYLDPKVHGLGPEFGINYNAAPIQESAKITAPDVKVKGNTSLRDLEK